MAWVLLIWPTTSTTRPYCSLSWGSGFCTGAAVDPPPDSDRARTLGTGRFVSGDHPRGVRAAAGTRPAPAAIAVAAGSVGADAGRSRSMGHDGVRRHRARH